MLHCLKNITPIFKLGGICWTAGVNEKRSDDAHFAKLVLDFP